MLRSIRSIESLCKPAVIKVVVMTDVGSQEGKTQLNEYVLLKLAKIQSPLWCALPVPVKIRMKEKRRMNDFFLRISLNCRCHVCNKHRSEVIAEAATTPYCSYAEENQLQRANVNISPDMSRANVQYPLACHCQCMCKYLQPQEDHRVHPKSREIYNAQSEKQCKYQGLCNIDMEFLQFTLQILPWSPLVHPSEKTVKKTQYQLNVTQIIQ